MCHQELSKITQSFLTHDDISYLLKVPNNNYTYKIVPRYQMDFLNSDPDSLFDQGFFLNADPYLDKQFWNRNWIQQNHKDP